MLKKKFNRFYFFVLQRYLSVLLLRFCGGFLIVPRGFFAFWHALTN